MPEFNGDITKLAADLYRIAGRSGSFAILDNNTQIQWMQKAHELANDWRGNQLFTGVEKDLDKKISMNYEPGQRAYKGFNEAYRGYHPDDWRDEDPRIKELWAKAEEACLVERNEEDANKKEPEYSEKDIEIGKCLYNYLTRTGLQEWDNLTDTEHARYINAAIQLTDRLERQVEDIKTDLESYRRIFDKMQSLIPIEFKNQYQGIHIGLVACRFIERLMQKLTTIAAIADAPDTQNESLCNKPAICGMPGKCKKQKGHTDPHCVDGFCWVNTHPVSNEEGLRSNLCLCGHMKSTHWGPEGSHNCDVKDCYCKGFRNASNP